MKKKSLLWLLLMLMCFPAYLRAADSSGIEQYTMPKKDGKQGDKTVESQLLFYDMGGPTGSTVSYYAGYTRFVPSDESAQVSITFNSLDLGGVAKVYIYDGDIEFTSYYGTVPEGYLAALSGTEAGQSYLSTTGSLSVLYHCKGSGSGDGWEALVQEVSSKPQVWQEATASQSDLGTAYPGKTAMPLLKVNLATDGGADPLTVSSLAFSLEGTTSLSDLENLRVVSSKASGSPQGEAFGATYDAASQQLTFSGSVALRSGNNYFWLLADVPTGATPGHRLDASLTSAIVGGEERLSAPLAPEGDFEIANMVLMSSTHTTHQVGDNPINFYDDGGPDGNISADFSGTTTFVPTTAGKKVRINFTKLDLFNTSSVGYNDELKVYYGQEADDAQLAATLLTETATINSTAADGSLTVTLKSTTGYPKPGFEALVEEFTPQAMTAQSLTASQSSTESVSAGTEGVEMLLIDLTTTGTEPALSASSFSFTTAGGTAPLTGASLYSLGNTTTGTKTLLGATDSPAGSFSIAAASPVSLREGHNYFLLTYDIDNLATQGSTLDATLVSATVGGSEVAATDGNPEGERTIDNVYYSAIGTFTRVIAGEWRYQNSPASYSYYGYDSTAGAQTVTFIPATEGDVIELEFSKFNITFPSYSYGNDPSFVVYDGADTSANVLWSMAKADKDSGPQGVIRATNAEGKLTVVFNAQGVTGSSGAGFTARVAEYKSVPMELTSVKAFQDNTNIILPEATDVEILGVKVLTTGDQNPLSLTSLSVDMKGCSDKVKTVKVYSTGSSATFATDTLVASAAVDASKAVQQLTLTDELTLLEKANYLWVAYDMQPGLASDLQIDAALSAIEIGGVNAEIAVSDPDGVRLTKNIYYFKGDDTVTVTDSMLFYDDGGADGNYTTDHSGTVTFMPAQGKIIRFIFNDFYTNVKDDFYVYDGTDTSLTPRLTLYSEKTGLDPVISTDDSGALTVKFEPTKNNTNRGWEIEVQAFEPAPLSITSIDAQPATDSPRLLKGSSDNAVLRIALTIEGEKGNVNLSSFNFSTLQSAASTVKKATLWTTGTSSEFLAVDSYGSVDSPSGDFTIEGTTAYRTAGTYYFWLAYDIDAAAPSAAAVQARFNSLQANVTAAEPTSTAMTTTLAEGMHGTYTVAADGSGQFTTLAAAVEALSLGVEGAVRIELAPGTYTELIAVPEIPGTSELNTVTICSQTGNADDVTVAYNTYTAPAYSETDVRYGVFTVKGADYLTLSALTFTTTDSSFPAVIFVRDVAQHLTVKDCRIVAPKSSSYSESINGIYMYSVSEADHNNDYFTAEGNTIENGYIGVTMGGTGTVALPSQKGGKVVGNTFKGQYSKAVYVSREESGRVGGNIIVADGSSTASSYYAIDLLNANGDFSVDANSITITNPTNSTVAIYVRPMSGTADAFGKIFNNEINISGINGGVTGMRVNTASPYLNIAYNTVRLSGSATAKPYGIFVYKAMENGVITNNIILNECAGYVYDIPQAANIPAGGISHNVGYTAGDYFAYVGADLSFDDWCTKAGDTDSYCESVEFLSDSVLEPAAAGSLLNAQPLAYAPTDIYGVARSLTAPTIGAYEYSESSSAPALVEGYPQIAAVAHDSATLRFKADATGTYRCLVVDASAQAPEASDFDDAALSGSMRKAAETSVALTSLSPKTTYKAYLLLTSLRGTASEPIASEPFTTTYAPTAVATFEDVTPVGSDGNCFADGTALFTGFEVVEVTDAVVEAPNSHAASLAAEAQGTIEPTNAHGLVLDGFFLRSEAEVALTALDAEGTATATKSVAASRAWSYINLRDMGPISYLQISSQSALLIDNFCGAPLDMEAAIETSAELPAHEGEAIELQAVVTGGVAPFTYSWTDASAAALGTDAALALTPQHSATYALQVTDAWGNQASASTALRVLGSQYTATFDDLYLPEESQWYGDTKDPDYYTGSFFSGSFEFNNLYMADWNSWAFFGYSNHTATGFSNYLTDQYNAITGSGYDGSANFGVLYASDWMGSAEVTLSNTSEGEVVDGFWFTNSSWVVDAILNGDGYSPKFDQGDYLALNITGVAANGDNITTECILADYRSENEIDHYYVDSWQWFDLRSLGEVVKLKFSMTSTKANSYGVTTPTYVCLDNFGGSREVRPGVEAVVEVNDENPQAQFSIEPYFLFYPEDGTITYSIEGGEDYATLQGDTVTVEAPVGTQFTIIAHAFQRGHNLYVEVPVTVNELSGISAATAPTGLAIYPNPARDYTTVSLAGSYDLQLFSLDGRNVLSLNGCSDATRVDCSSLPAGSYLVRALTPSGSALTGKLLISK